MILELVYDMEVCHFMDPAIFHIISIDTSLCDFCVTITLLRSYDFCCVASGDNYVSVETRFEGP